MPRQHQGSRRQGQGARRRAPQGATGRSRNGQGPRRQKRRLNTADGRSRVQRAPRKVQRRSALSARAEGNDSSNGRQASSTARRPVAAARVQRQSGGRQQQHHPQGRQHGARRPQTSESPNRVAARRHHPAQGQASAAGAQVEESGFVDTLQDMGEAVLDQAAEWLWGDDEETSTQAPPAVAGQRYTVNANAVPYEWIRDELELEDTLASGDRGDDVLRAQEWLSLHGFGTATDGHFGSATEQAVRQFQASAGLSVSGIVDDATYAALVQPLARALQPIHPGAMSCGELAAAYAEQFLAEHPREVGGQNKGVWVRVFMDGNDGSQFAWCAGFACFMHRLAADAIGEDVCFEPSWSCDALAQEAQRDGLFLSEHELTGGSADPGDIPVGSLFLSRKSADDWTHTGLVIAVAGDTFVTIEGNTNDEGHREGYEVCRRTRTFPGRDFVLALD